jgi:glutathione synthase/RimK-type ligase-like ATP-grasp enzyme
MIETLNRDCHCISLDREALRRALQADPASSGLHELIEERCPYLFASMPLFVSREHVRQMGEVIGAVERVVALPDYRETALAWAPEIARLDPGTKGVFVGYDFHLAPGGPRLIEINTNAGGALLNAVLARAQRACCREIEPWMSGAVPDADIERTLFDMFVAEWRRAGRAGTPRRVAIVDDAPQAQFMYPEFLLFARLFERFGVEAAVLAPEALAFDSGALRDALGPVDLVYNRLTDFYFELPAHVALRETYLANAAVVTPHPRAHALYADKRNLNLLGSPALLRAWGVAEADIRTLETGIPRTEIVSAANAERLWAERRRLFFKPAAGHGSRAAYRGEKLTRRVWSEILAGTYVAQELVPPSERRIAPETALKVDVRNYVYDGHVQMLAARLYQGQTTNMRTAGGGFAPVLTTPLDAWDPEPAPAPRSPTESPAAA